MKIEKPDYKCRYKCLERGLSESAAASARCRLLLVLEITSYYLSKYNSLPIPTQEQYLAYLDQAVKNARNNHNFTGKEKFNWYASFEEINNIVYSFLISSPYLPSLKYRVI